MSRLQRARVWMESVGDGSWSFCRLIHIGRELEAWRQGNTQNDCAHEVAEKMASIALDGYPASWPRPLRKKERRR